MCGCVCSNGVVLQVVAVDRKAGCRQPLKRGMATDAASETAHLTLRRVTAPRQCPRTAYEAMVARKSSVGTRGRANAPAASLTTAARGFVEFHPSMSLENAPALADCLPEPAKAVFSSHSSAEQDSKDITLDQVLADRCQVWTKVNEVVEKLTPLHAYQGDIHALQKLQQLHLLCKQRETHLRTLQLTLLREGRAPAPPSAEAVIPTEIDQGDNCVDASNANETEWQQEQERHLDFVDYDAMDLIELSEQFA